MRARSDGAAGVPSPQELAGEAAAFILDRFRVSAVDLAFVLGSGWSAAADDLGDGIGECGLPELPGFARPSDGGRGRGENRRTDQRLRRTESGLGPRHPGPDPGPHQPDGYHTAGRSDLY